MRTGGGEQRITGRRHAHQNAPGGAVGGCQGAAVRSTGTYQRVPVTARCQDLGSYRRTARPGTRRFPTDIKHHLRRGTRARASSAHDDKPARTSTARRGTLTLAAALDAKAVIYALAGIDQRRSRPALPPRRGRSNTRADLWKLTGATGALGRGRRSRPRRLQLTGQAERGKPDRRARGPGVRPARPERAAGPRQVAPAAATRTLDLDLDVNRAPSTTLIDAVLSARELSYATAPSPQPTLKLTGSLAAGKDRRPGGWG